MELDELHEGVSQSPAPARNRENEGGVLSDPETVAQQRRATAVRMGSLAAAGHHAAGDLEEHFPQVARRIHDAAAGCEQISNFLHDPHLDGVTTFIGNLGRKQPAAVLAGALLIAMGLAWFLKGSGDMSGSAMADDRERGTYGVH
jgi:hypothetical protein